MSKSEWAELWHAVTRPIGVFALAVLVLLALSSLLLIRSLKPKVDTSKPRQDDPKPKSRLWWFVTGILIVLSTLSLALLCVALGTDSWGILVALVPPALMAQHAVFLRIVRKPKLKPIDNNDDRTKQSDGTREATKPAEQGNEKLKGDQDWWHLVVAAAKEASESYFGVGSLFLRYGTSALAFLLVALVAYFAFFADTVILELHDYARYARPAAFGAAGAYVYTLLYLGRRNIVHDVTSGGAMWCTISLAAGPILACMVSRFLTPSGKAGVDLGVLYFIAGFSPRYVTTYIEGLAKQGWQTSPVTSMPAVRTTPLTQVKGITPDIAERLAEEGIEDVRSLAMADPLRLIRNTNFDKRLIVSWIDEALLITALSEDDWKFLEKEGLTGAIDLVELVWRPPYPPYKDDEVPGHTHERSKNDYLDIIGKRLESHAGNGAPGAPKHNAAWLAGVATILYDDEQVRRIWVLHNHLSET